MGDSNTVRDIRRTPFCWQEKAALALVRAHYSGERLKQRVFATAVYVALTEVASNQFSVTHVETTVRALWELTGTSESTVKRCLREFETIGLIAVERRKVAGDISLPNVYSLLNPGSPGGPTPSGEGVLPGSPGEPTPSGVGPLQEELTLKKTTKEGTVPQDPFLRWRRSVGR
jgi:hypothetical protein